MSQVFRHFCRALLLLLCLPLAAQAVELRDVRLWDGPDATRVVLDLEGGTEHKAFPLANPNRLVIDIRDARKAPGLKLKGLAKGVVKGVRTGPRDDGLRVVIDLAESVSASTFGLEPNGEYGYRLVFDLKVEAPAAVPEAIIAAPAPPVVIPPPVAPPPPPPPQGELLPLVVAPQVVIVPALPDLAVLPRAQRPWLPKVLATPKPKLRPKPVEEPFIDIPEPTPAPVEPPVVALPAPPPPPVSAPRPSGPVRPIVIAIDPGHGGADPGARGVNGVLEKHVCLQIAKRLAKLLDATPGYKAVLTRTGDQYLALRERTSVARRAHADLFVSIHANSMPVTNSIRGSAVYVLSERGASSEHAKMLANLENSADLVGGVPLKSQDDDLASVLLDISQTAVREASFDLASRLLGSIGRSYKLQKREPQQAGFAVLKSPDMPSVLVETAFLSDERDERMLASPEHQQAIAQSLFNGVRSYFSAYRPQSQVSFEPEPVTQPVNLKRKKR